jgi:hypothetical protein
VTTILVTHSDGDDPSEYAGRCAAGANLTIRVSLFAADGTTPRDLTNKLVVLGWAAPSTVPANRYEEIAVAGVAAYDFSVTQTQALEFESAKFDVWVESLDSHTRERVVGVSVVAFDEGIAPPRENSYYYGVGEPGLSSVATLTSAALLGVFTFTVSPVSQKVYFVHPTSVVIASILHNGLPLGVLPSRSITVEGIAYTVIESTWELTYPDLDFIVTRVA